MTTFRKALLGAGAALAVTAYVMPAQAVTITSPASLTLISLGTDGGTGLVSTATRTDANSTTTFTSTTPTQNGFQTGIYSGTSANGAYTSPFGAGSNQNYYAVQPGGSITIAYNFAQTSFGLLFGTADNYNSLSFTTTGASGTQTFTGADVMAALGSTANGTMNRNVLFSGLNSFTTVTATDTTQSAFEFVPAAVASTVVPEPMSLALLGASLVGMGALRRRSAK